MHTYPQFAARELRVNLEKLLPIVALVVSVAASVVIGGAGSLAFPLPCAYLVCGTLLLPATCLLTFITGAIEIILVANSIINIAVATPLSDLYDVFCAAGYCHDGDLPGDGLRQHGGD